MNYPCKVVRPCGGYEYADAACFGWYADATSNDGPAIEAPDPMAAALAALRRAVDLRVDIGMVDGVAEVIAVVREGAREFTVRAVVRTTIERKR